MEMETFKAYLKKEIMESSRQYRYVVLAAGIIIFAILDPFMLKLLPGILKSKLPGDFSSLFIVNPKYAVNNYIKDLTQIGNLFVVFTLGGVLSEEIDGEKLVFPYSKGSKPFGIVLAKVLHYTAAVTLFTFVGFATAFYYSSILLKGQSAAFSGVMNSAFLMSVYFFFNITLAVLLSSIMKKGIAAGFSVIAVNIAAALIVNIEGIGMLMPYKLVEMSYTFTLRGGLLTLIFVVMTSLIFIALSVLRMSKVEVI
jgi:ABC-2 type transport system permease protein